MIRKNNIEFLKVIGEKNRFFILQLLKEKELCVCQIWKKLNLAQNLTSHHLQILKDFGLIDSKKQGKKVIYFLNKKNIEKHFSLIYSKIL